MTDSEITISILREIRDAIVVTNVRIDNLDKNLSGRIDSLDKNLSGRIDETNARLTVVEHVVKDAAEQIMFLGRYAKNAIEDLRERVTRLEAKGTS
ncbi:MAG: hypothetical protein H0T89_00470 [Deltaproteobacteria bacterium]|nr:hypothetical protein [Deltaproteobacteria bacterium]MDQ3301543.1 hypothetical protein [Myxococcota bacterium]